jgi:2-oxoglutarate dehydrogenase complex dehydrogenase (E1) component-like enzyme
VIPEEGSATENPSGVKKLVFCSGKVYYDLKKARNEKNLEKDIAIARVEQVQNILLLHNLLIVGCSNIEALSH